MCTYRHIAGRAQSLLTWCFLSGCHDASIGTSAFRRNRADVVAYVIQPRMFEVRPSALVQTFPQVGNDFPDLPVHCGSRWVSGARPAPALTDKRSGICPALGTVHDRTPTTAWAQRDATE